MLSVMPIPKHRTLGILSDLQLVIVQYCIFCAERMLVSLVKEIVCFPPELPFLWSVNHIFYCRLLEMGELCSDSGLVAADDSEIVAAVFFRVESSLCTLLEFYCITHLLANLWLLSWICYIMS